MPVLTALALAVTLAVIAVLVGLGLAGAGNAARHFRAGGAATYYSGLLLAASAAVAATLGRSAGQPALRGVWWTIAGAFAYFCLDQVYGLHEEMDHAIHRLAGPPGESPWLPRNLDDAIIALYGVAALVWADRHLEQLVRCRWTALLFASAFACFVPMAALDFAGRAKWLEDSLKLVAETLVLAGLLGAYGDPASRSPAATSAP
jgi:hypothetical protein